MGAGNPPPTPPVAVFFGRWTPLPYRVECLRDLVCSRLRRLSFPLSGSPRLATLKYQCSRCRRGEWFRKDPLRDDNYCGDKRVAIRCWQRGLLGKDIIYLSKKIKSLKDIDIFGFVVFLPPYTKAERSKYCYPPSRYPRDIHHGKLELRIS